MSVLSLTYLALSGLSAVFVWLFPGRTRKYTVMLVNIAFLVLLWKSPMAVYYSAGLCVYTWLAGLLLEKKHHKAVLAAALALPVLGLCFFKYVYDFTGWYIMMPLGISFYTFKAVGYLADIYENRFRARDLIDVFDYLIFFPAFTAGPIHRPAAFFEQLEKPWTFDYRDQKNGVIQAGAGMFQKLVIAEELARMTKLFLYNPEVSGWYTWFGVLLYTFQIYVDFDSYSNIAIGTARMLGFRLERNFHTPYLSSSIQEFWRRWHISLSCWLRDYVYIPLGGSRKGSLRKYINILIVFLVSGMWHGSAKVFIIWGLGHGVLNVIEGMIREKWGKLYRTWMKAPLILFNFACVAFLWIFFCAGSGEAAAAILHRMAAAGGPAVIGPAAVGITMNEWIWTFALIAVIIVSDLMRCRTDMIEWLAARNFAVRWAVYFVLMVTAIIFGVYGPGYDPSDFIYVTF